MSFELLTPARFVELASSPEEGAAMLGVVLAASFGTAAAGALLAPSLRWLLAPSLRWLLGGSTRLTCAALTVLGAAGLAMFAGADVVVLSGMAFASYYVAYGATWPLLSTVLHSRVASAQRATAVSAMSLAMAVGGISGNLVLPRVAEAVDLEAAFRLVAALVLLSGLLCLRLPSSTARASGQVGVESHGHPGVAESTAGLAAGPWGDLRAGAERPQDVPS